MLRGYVPLISKMVASSVGTKAILLVLESVSKVRTLKLGVDYSPEETSGIFNRSLLWWLNELLWKGYNGVLKQKDLFPLNEELRTAKLRDRMIECWAESRRL